MFKYEAIFSNVLATSVLPVLRSESIKIAEKIRKEVIRRITQQVGLKPELNERYRKRKIKYGYGSDTLIMTRQYIDSIIVIPTAYGATVGVKNVLHWTPTLTGRVTRPRTRPETIERSGGKAIPMFRIAEWMEYGTTRSKKGKGRPRSNQPWHTPPRPHWRPAQQKFIRELRQTRERLTKAMTEAMERALAIELANNPESDGQSPPQRFTNEPRTRSRFNKVRLTRAARLMNRKKRNEYEKVGLTPPEDVDDPEDL